MEAMNIRDLKPGLKNVNLLFVVLDVGQCVLIKKKVLVNRLIEGFLIIFHTQVGPALPKMAMKYVHVKLPTKPLRSTFRFGMNPAFTFSRVTFVVLPKGLYKFSIAQGQTFD